MAQIIREIRVDVSQPNVFQAIVAKQLDCNSRFLKITLVDFGVKIEVPETAKVTINANRPDGKSQSFVGVANNDGTITVPLAQWMLEVAGELKCDVSVINTTDNKRLTSTDFFVNVQEAANKSTDISENPDGEIRVITPTQKIDKNSSDDEYPSAKAVYELDNITATASGSAITVDSANAPLQNLKLYGKTEQDGTPTPDNPIELKSVGDSGSFEVGVYCGKNLLENNATNVTANGITFTINSDKSISVSGTPTGVAVLTLPITLPAGTYILSGAPKLGGNAGLYLPIAELGTTISQLYDEETFTITQPLKSEVRVRIGTDFTAGKCTFYPMIRLATETDNTYEPCNKQTLSMPYTLYGIGRKEEVDLNKGSYTKRFNALTFDGSDDEAWSVSAKGDYYMASIDIARGSMQFITPCLCNRSTYSAEWKKNTCFINNYSHFIFTWLADLGISDVASFRTWLSSNPIKIVYERETPIETPLTETELNAYRQLMTNKGTTTILSECEDTEITYYVNKPNAQAIGSLHEQINKDYLKLQQAIISTGGSTL